MYKNRKIHFISVVKRYYFIIRNTVSTAGKKQKL